MKIIQWDSIDGFKYGFGPRSPMHYDIHLPEFLEEKLSGEEITIDKIKNRHVSAVTEDDSTVHSWSLYKCIYTEVVLHNQTFILNGGYWYQVDKDFVKRIDDFYNSLPKCSLNFPEYNHNTETEYNAFVALESDNFALMDKKFVYNIEFCDLYEKNRNIIHVKRYGASSVLSHLFMQGLNSAELFQTDVGFRKGVNNKLPETHKISSVDERPKHYEYEIVYAIVSDSDGETLELPFFSKLTLRNACKRLDGFGYKISLKKILVNKNKKSLKKLPPGKSG